MNAAVGGKKFGSSARLIFGALAAALVLSAGASAQMPKVAVYVSEHSGYSPDEKSALRTATLNTLVRNGQFEVIERSEVLEEELEIQAGGTVDEGQLVAFGRQMGAEYVCVSDITSPFHSQNYQVSARMINVETAEIAGLGVVEANIASGYALSSAVVYAVGEMLKSVPRSAPTDTRKTTVYVEGGADKRTRDVLYTYMLNALFGQSRAGGNFKVVERSESFTGQIDKEQMTQRGGAVDDSQIARLGMQYGIKNICVASIEYSSNTYILSTRVIDIETANTVNISQMHYVPRDSISLGKLRAISASMANEAQVFNPVDLSRKVKVAVYVSESSQGDKVLLRAAAVNRLSKSGNYLVVDRSNIIDAELIKQASGDVDDDQLAAFGRQSGARYVCIPEMLSPFGTRHIIGRGEGAFVDYQVSARLIDVETAEVAALGVNTLTLRIENRMSGQTFSNAVGDAVDEMLKTVSQNKADANAPAMAVYVSGQRANQAAGSAFYTYVLNALFTRSVYNGDFKVVERSAAFTRQLDRELGAQHSGAVDDGQISRMGKQYGVKHILAANIDYAMNSYNISVRLINVETAKVEKASKLYQYSPACEMEACGMEGCRTLSVRMVEDMITRKKSQDELEKERTHMKMSLFVGGGVSLMMNSLDTVYKYNGGQFTIGFDWFSNHTDFFHYGVGLNWGGIGYRGGEVDKVKDIVENVYPGVNRDIIEMGSGFLNIGPYVKLYPADILYFSGGVSFGWRYSDVHPKPDSKDMGNDDFDMRSMISVIEPVFSVGTGIAILHGHNDEGGAGIILEAQYNMIPVNDKLAGYLSINLTIGACRRGVGRIFKPKEI